MTHAILEQPDADPILADDTVMEDFIFGGIEADIQQRLAQEQARWSGLRHQYAIDPLDPLPGQPVTVTVTVGPDVVVDRITLYLTTDSSDPAGRRGVASNGIAIACQRVDVRWETLLWDYVEVWQAQIGGQPEHTFVQYRIEGWCSYDDRPSLWSREANLDRTVERTTLYGYHVDRFQAPPWAHEAIVYQIFVDRFASGKEEHGTGSAGRGARNNSQLAIRNSQFAIRNPG